MKLSLPVFALAALPLGACVASRAGVLVGEGTGALAPVAAAPFLAPGRWQLVLVVPAGEPYASTYSGTLVLIEQQGLLYGSVGDWSNGARSRLVGWHRDGQFHLARTDEAPWAGFRAAFDGTVSVDGSWIQGTCYNDPHAPNGNSATCTFSARRLPDPPAASDRAPL